MVAQAIGTVAIILLFTAAITTNKIKQSATRALYLLAIAFSLALYFFIYKKSVVSQRYLDSVV